MSEVIGKTLGGYTILEHVGRGGVASVFKAQDRDTQQIVALKILAPQLALEPKFRERFKREAQVLSRLEHPHIVPILDYGESNGLFYIVMPFMQVGGLHDYMKNGPLDVGEGARIFSQIAAALQYAHNAGVVHRDVKPSNILIDINGNAWLSDFGFAHVGDASVSLTGSAMIGTPAYIAPEVVIGNPATPASDQYSLGVVLFQMSTGYLPFDADTPMAVAIKQASEPLPRPRWVNPNLPDAVEGVLLKVLSKEPEERFKSISAFNKAFLCALNEAVDLDSGILKPGARGLDASTEAHESAEVELVDIDEGGTAGELERKRRTTLALLFLSLLALPLACWMGVRLGSGIFSVTNQVTEVAEAGSSQDMEATFAALSTTLAPRGKTMMATGEVETMVALTVTAMLEQGEGLILASTTPTVTSQSVRLLSETPEDVAHTDTATKGPPTATYTRSPPTSAGGSGPSNTLAPTNTLPPGITASATQIPADTHTPTTSQTPTITYTLNLTITPTLTTTQAFTSTSTPSQTHTKTVTPSPPPDPCDGISIDNFSTPWRDVEWRVTNSSGSTITITAIWIDWPTSNDALERVEFGGDGIWFGDDENPPSSMPPWFGWSRDRQLRNNRDKDLEFRFEDIAASTGYDLMVTFDNGCTIQTQE